MRRDTFLKSLAAMAAVGSLPVSAQTAALKMTDRKFNRMRPSMARVLGLETRSAKEG